MERALIEYENEIDKDRMENTSLKRDIKDLLRELDSARSGVEVMEMKKALIKYENEMNKERKKKTLLKCNIKELLGELENERNRESVRGMEKSLIEYENTIQNFVRSMKKQVLE